MNILFVTSHLHLPQLHGGLQASTDELCRYLTKKGHNISLLAGLNKDGEFGKKAHIKLHINQVLRRHKITKDTTLGYPVWRTWFAWEEVRYVAKQTKPDLVVVKSGNVVRIASELKSSKVPLVVQLHDVEFHLHNGNLNDLGNVAYIANSHFTAQKYQENFGVRPYVVNPFITAEKYRTASTRENVTFINPHPQKGVDIAIQVARLCPKIPFAFVEAWRLNDADKARLDRELATLPNVKLYAATDDMKKVYSKSRILLVPSRWNEAYGRVVSEAQFSGIPVVASNRGGLPESVGTGGILINPDGPIEPWVTAVQKLWYDQEYYNRMSVEAYMYSNRPALNLNKQIRRFEDIFTDVVDAQRAA